MIVRKKCLMKHTVNNVNLMRMMSFGNGICKKCVHCKCVFSVDNVVALIPNNEFQPLHCVHVHFLNKTTSIENQQC